MPLPKPLLLAFLGSTSLTLADFSGVDVFWTDNFGFANPFVDNSEVALQGGDVVQVGYFAGVLATKNPASYSLADWASFTPLTGDGSSNPLFYPTTIATPLQAPQPGYFAANISFDTDVHMGVPLTDVRIGIRLFDASTVATATNINTATSGADSWIMLAPGNGINTPFPADANLDTGDLAGTLLWEGTPFKTDLVPGVTPPSLELTKVTQTGATTLQVSWSGGDGSNDVQTSTDGITFNTVSAGQASPATITIDPVGTKNLLVRVIEP